MQAYLLVALGSALGGVARYAVGVALPSPDDRWPWATFAVNVAGALAIGLFYPALASDGTRHFAVVGVLGGFTTFSAFSLQTFELVRLGRPLLALGYAIASVVACVLAAALGYAIATGSTRLS
jgi:fluoride exporter